MSNEVELTASMPEDVKELVAEWKKAAEGVTPGSWSREDTADYAEIHPASGRLRSAIALVGQPWDADWIARCSPFGVRTLLDALASLSAKVEEAHQRYVDVNEARIDAEAALAERDRIIAEKDKALKAIAEGRPVNPVGDPWLFYDDLVNVARAARIREGGEPDSGDAMGGFRNIGRTALQKDTDK